MAAAGTLSRLWEAQPEGQFRAGKRAGDERGTGIAVPERGAKRLFAVGRKRYINW